VGPKINLCPKRNVFYLAGAQDKENKEKKNKDENVNKMKTEQEISKTNNKNKGTKAPEKNKENRDNKKTNNPKRKRKEEKLLPRKRKKITENSKLKEEVKIKDVEITDDDSNYVEQNFEEIVQNSSSYRDGYATRSRVAFKNEKKKENTKNERKKETTKNEKKQKTTKNKKKKKITKKKNKKKASKIKKKKETAKIEKITKDVEKQQNEPISRRKGYALRRKKNEVNYTDVKISGWDKVFEQRSKNQVNIKKTAEKEEEEDEDDDDEIIFEVSCC
jgi:hypothetical protein